MMEFGLSDMLATIEAKLFLNRTVGELLFDGYDDPILEIGASFDDEERTLPIDKFGWFYKVCKNISFTIHIFFTQPMMRRGTGPAGLTALSGCTRARGTWTDWATSSHGTAGTGPTPTLGPAAPSLAPLTASLRRGSSRPGTSSTSGPPTPAGNEAVTYFCYGNIFRKLTFERIGQTSVHGIPVQKFSLSDLVFDNGTKCKVS